MRAVEGGEEKEEEVSAWLAHVRLSGPLVTWDEVPDPKPQRTGTLRAYGNAIVGPLAAAFVGAVIDVLTSDSVDGADS